VSTPLGLILRERIAKSGPVSVAEFMELALAHPDYGYYRRKDPLGVAGDFTTAPEISQMFGEMVGLWLAVVWQGMGAPSRFILAEAGPGRGTLMADILRAGGMVPGFRQAAELHLVETSPALRAKQAEPLKDASPHWHDDLASLPEDAPLLFVANEFLDALPIRQYVRVPDGWRERLVGRDGSGFAFVEGPLAAVSAPAGQLGDICEINEPARAVAALIGSRLAIQGGAALLIDYGYEKTAVGDTLQAVRQHAYAPVLEAIGESDLTAHVDFDAFARAAAGARAYPLLNQGKFLRSMGIELRAERLRQSQPSKSDEIMKACRRLIDAAEMGTLFKVLCLTAPNLPIPPGFAADDS